MGLKELALAVASAPEPPCLKNGVMCKFWQECADRKLACEAYYNYVNPEKRMRRPSKTPSARMFAFIFDGPSVTGQLVRPHLRGKGKRGKNKNNKLWTFASLPAPA